MVEEQKVKVLVAKDVDRRRPAAQRNGHHASGRTGPNSPSAPNTSPKPSLPDALTEMNDAIARFEIFAGEPITDLKLVRSDQGYLSAVLGKGHARRLRAGQVPMPPPAASSSPTTASMLCSTRDGISQTILANVKILALGTRLGQVNTASKNKEEGDKDAAEVQTFSGSTVATLELTPAQGELIINATRLGTLARLCAPSLTSLRPTLKCPATRPAAPSR